VLTPGDAVRRLAAATGEDVTLVGALTGGETGAHEVLGPDGRRFVLKWEDVPSRRAAREVGVVLAERLRTSAGWPVPRQWTVVDDGWLLVWQELLPGAVVACYTHAIVDELFALHDRRLGLAQPGDVDDWPEHLVETLVVGSDTYCIHESLREFDARSRAIVERIEEIGRATDPDALRGDDVVHADLHGENLLQVDGRLSAVIDLDFARIGDAAFDLTSIAVNSLELDAEPGARERLLERGIDDVPPERRLPYVAHTVLKCLDWSIRKGRFDEVERWLRLAPGLFEA
jgi:hypothetical protein